ncbi:MULTISPECIES: copper chaperone CopZ [unclassified Rummeliibacillus]|uniref:copper chaperone CopZ n=1 Tax=unclassified Rummeliibacillus TaxID=2622809 RepID=UPI000E66F680|nr:MULTISPECIES: copper chaperone CopZ [unclassified Rummeliibacillus]RIJ64369.1 copper chaperone [Rummeliibacillus sp. POC4]RPJ96533.1 copper chaperone [Rummeliibacillus sp. TYF005]
MTEKIQLNVEGMSCGHCVKAVENGVGSLNGVQNVSVNLEKGLVDVDYDNSKVTTENIKEAIEEEGYIVK